MRTRDLKPGFFRDEELAKLPHATRIVYAGLWCLADRRGRLPDNAKTIGAEIFPHESTPVERHLKELSKVGFIHRYEADGTRCIWIPRFLDHQKPHPNEAESLLPPSPLEGSYEGKKSLHANGVSQS